MSIIEYQPIMKNICFINALGTTKYLYSDLGSGKNALDYVFEYIGTVPEITKTVLLSNSKISREGIDCIEIPAGSSFSDLLEIMFKKASDFEHIFYIFADTPLLEPGVSKKMFANHIKYFAEYSFADGYPEGMTPEIIKTRILPIIGEIAKKHDRPITRTSFFDCIQKDINSFDIETEISPRDLRLLRVALRCDKERNFMICKNLIELNALDSPAVIDTLTNRPEILRSKPAYFSIQIIDGCPQHCSYCPFPIFGGDILNQRNEMSLANFNIVLDKIKAYTDDGVISLSLWGEPSLHTNISDIIKAVHTRSDLDLIIETTGVGWTEETITQIVRDCGNYPRWIVSLDSNNPQIYQKIHGNGFEEAQRNTTFLMKNFPGNVYVQAIRTRGAEEHLESFYREWKKITENLIIQKYDHFCGELPQLKVTDLSPLKRFPCWHLKRDISIRIDGSVPLCREDINSSTSFGNIFEDTLEIIWKNGTSIYKKHIDSEYPDLCSRCDEYYTYNF
jgi:spiro-SPASM protein